MRTNLLLTLTVAVLTASGSSAAAAEDEPLVRSAGSGSWSDPTTWESGRMSGVAARVVVRPAHRVTYDVADGPAIRSVRVGGVLAFARDRDTRRREPGVHADGRPAARGDLPQAARPS